MVAIFHDMIEKTMELFMDDFSVFGDSFSSCLSHLDKMLQRCEDTNLMLNWEKCHFMVKEGIVLGHNISKTRIEVDKAKVDVIAKLPYPTTVKEFRDTLIQHIESVKKSIGERAQHKMEYERRVNERQVQTTEEKTDTSNALDALDASSVIIESNGTESKEQDTSSRSGNDAHDADADIRPI
ncbi:reverse transcriptase domain-containing protein [Tanacetum coccineum]